MKFKKIIFRPNARQMMAVASFQIMSASLFFILYYRASLWAPQAYKYHNEVRCGHDLYAFKDMLQKLDENHPSQLEVSSWPNLSGGLETLDTQLIFTHQFGISMQCFF